jgi:hypothetical protein
VIRALLVTAIAAVAQLVLAADPATYSVDIPSQDLGTALLRFATLTHHQIAFDHKLVEGYRSPALAGTYTDTSGLEVLVSTAPLVIHTTPAGVLTITSAPAALVGEAAAAASAARTSRERSEVIVSGKRDAERAELAPKVSAFVNEIASVTDGDRVEGRLPRWQKALCPLVSGLPREEGEFILARVSEIARDAGVALGGEHCQPNLYILVTLQPRELLQGMRKRNRFFTFGPDPYPAVVNEFIATPRPVRVWYNTTLLDAWGLHPGDAFPGDVESYDVIPKSEPSRLLSNIAYPFSRVFVIVDQRRLQGVTRGQLADYVAMVGLAQIKPTAGLGAARTILKLFIGGPQAAPAGLSDWDRAFLKSLYGTEPRSKIQRTLIARSMVRQIVP